MPFEKFTHRGGRGRYAFSVVTLQASGGMSLNEVAYEELGRPSHVILSYDEDESRVGLEPSDGGEQYAFPVREWGDNRNWAISIKSFYRYYGIETRNTKRYRTTIEDGMLVFDLDAPIASLKPRERRPQKEVVEQED